MGESLTAHERASPESRKRIVWAVLEEIVSTVQGNRILLRLHWQGGDQTEVTVRKSRRGHHRWTEARVRGGFRTPRGIAVYRVKGNARSAVN